MREASHGRPLQRHACSGALFCHAGDGATVPFENARNHCRDIRFSTACRYECLVRRRAITLPPSVLTLTIVSVIPGPERREGARNPLGLWIPGSPHAAPRNDAENGRSVRTTTLAQIDHARACAPAAQNEAASARGYMLRPSFIGRLGRRRPAVHRQPAQEKLVPVRSREWDRAKILVPASVAVRRSHATPLFSCRGEPG